MKERLKAPELRFPGFTDDWEERKAKEMIKTHHFRSYLAEPNDVGNYEVIQQGDKPIAGYANGEPFEYFYDVTLFGDHTVSLFKPTKPFFIATDGVKIISADEFDGRYFYVTLERYKPASQGYKRHFTILKNEDIWFTTNKDEQVKIGTFFKQLDDTIALHQRKLDLLKEQKKGYLQKMFPKNGAKVPELRFAGFADDWEERKFKDIIEKLTGGASIKPSDYLEEGIRTIPKGAVNSTGLADLSGSKYISEEFYESNKSSHVSTNNLVTSLRDLVPSAPNMGRIVRIAGEDEDFLMPQGVYKLELFDGMDEEFLIAFSNSDKYRKIISSEKNGSTQVHIRNGEFLNIDIELPFSEEQKQIGSFFKQLDNSIALHQHKLDLLKEQKKGFLQKMFV